MKRADVGDDAPDGHVKPEHLRLHSIADHEMKMRPGLSRRRAVANILEANVAFSERARREHTDHVMGSLGQNQGTTKMIDFKKMAD